MVPDDVQAVLALHGRQMRVRKGQVLLAVGLPATDVYVVLEGSVSVSLVSAQGRETVLRAIGAREMFGELAAIDGEPRSADVVAVENSTLLVIPGPTFAGLLGVEPVLSLWLARYLSHQVRYLTNRIYELSTMGVGPRLQAELLRLAGEPDQAGAATINRIPTQAELAARIGTNRDARILAADQGRPRHARGTAHRRAIGGAAGRPAASLFAEQLTIRSAKALPDRVGRG